MPAQDFDPGPSYSRFDRVKFGDSVRVRLFSGAATSDSALSRRGVDGRDTPRSQSGGGQDGGAPEAHQG